MDMPHLIELDWHAAMGDGADNGSLALWIDGHMSSLITGVDNDTRRIDTTRLGAIAGIDNGTRGFYHFDAFESRRLTYIGEDPTASIAMAEPAVVTDLAEIAAWTEVDESEPEEAALLQEVLDYAEQVEQEASGNDELQQEEQHFLPWLND